MWLDWPLWRIPVLLQPAMPTEMVARTMTRGFGTSRIQTKQVCVPWLPKRACQHDTHQHATPPPSGLSRDTYRTWLPTDTALPCRILPMPTFPGLQVYSQPRGLALAGDTPFHYPAPVFSPRQATRLRAGYAAHMGKQRASTCMTNSRHRRLPGGTSTRAHCLHHRAALSFHGTRQPAGNFMLPAFGWVCLGLEHGRYHWFSLTGDSPSAIELPPSTYTQADSQLRLLPWFSPSTYLLGTVPQRDRTWLEEAWKERTAANTWCCLLPCSQTERTLLYLFSHLGSRRKEAKLSNAFMTAQQQAKTASAEQYSVSRRELRTAFISSFTSWPLSPTVALILEEKLALHKHCKKTSLLMGQTDTPPSTCHYPSIFSL